MKIVFFSGIFWYYLEQNIFELIYEVANDTKDAKLGRIILCKINKNMLRGFFCVYIVLFFKEIIQQNTLYSY